ncbi:MAG: divalent-cation tolerance protein CutA [Blastocatellia bacterium]|nr:divalent-cation tolerance protein CutA [Blastocatellia bacterium]
MNEALVVLTTVENPAEGERLARLLVESELAACVQIIPSITSIYRWEGKLEIAGESLLLIKTHKNAYQALENLLRQHHNYSTPEILSLPVEFVLNDYLDWLKASVRKFE